MSLQPPDSGYGCTHISFVEEAYNAVCFSISELIFWSEVAVWLVLAVNAFVIARSSPSSDLNCKKNKTR